jgi:sugar lactone lactonase YvrE
MLFRKLLQLVIAIPLISMGCATHSTRGTAQASRHAVRTGAEAQGVQLATADGAAGESTNILEPVAVFYGPMPTGVSVSRQGRIFANYPKWGDDVDFTVAEIRNGHEVPFPSADINRYQKGREADTLVSVQSVVVDPADRLWILDTGSMKFGPTVDNGPKLVCVDLNSNHVVKKILFPRDVASRTSYLNDVRFDLRRGNAGMAFITDSTDKGPNGIIVVDLDSGRSWRRLSDHPSTKADPDLVPAVEGEPLMVRPPAAPARRLAMGSDGIAISPDGRTLYYTPLVSRHLYSVSVDALADPGAGEADVAATVQDLGDRGFCSDGLEQDSQGRVYLTDYEHNAVRRRNTDGGYEIIVQDPRLIWPDTLSLAPDGYLYCTANQLNRQAMFHRGDDKRRRPFVLFRVQTDGQPATRR